MIVSGQNVVEWVSEGIGGTPHNGLVALGYVNSNNDLIAAFTFENFNGTNIVAHQRIIATPPRAFWRAVSKYLFTQLDVKRVTGATPLSNVKAHRFLKHIGFTQEGVMKGAARDGGDVAIMVLWRDDCIFLNW